MQLRHYQNEAVEAVFNYFRSESGNPLLVAPTGAGKAVILADIARRLLSGAKGEHRSILVLAHRKELVAQNAEKFRRLAPDMDLGIWSAGLGIKKRARVTFGGIQSVYKNGAAFGYQSLVMIDECHLLSKKATGMYQTLIAALKKTNPRLKIFGCSATPFRLDSGSLVGGTDAIFTDICHEIGIRELIDGGWLVPLISKGARTEVGGLDEVRVVGGDYVGKELEFVMNEAQLVKKACGEVVERAGNRTRWLVFCSGVDHTIAVRNEFRERGIDAEMVLGDTWGMERDRIIQNFKGNGLEQEGGKLKVLCNCDVLTTGFDAPNVDLIALLRPTQSAGLFMQMCGRGMRLAEGKKDCLVLDFGGNIERFGPIDTIKVKHHKQGGKSAIEKRAQKRCPECDEWVAARANECSCGYEFPPPPVQHSALPSAADILSQQKNEWFDIEQVDYSRHKKEGKPDSFKVTYFVKDKVWPKKLYEFVCLEHGGFATAKARGWWKRRQVSDFSIPADVGGALKMAGEGELKAVESVRAILEGKFWRIVEVKFKEVGEEIDTIKEFGLNI